MILALLEVVRIKTESQTWGGVKAKAGDYFTCLHGTEGSSVTQAVSVEPGRTYTLSWYERSRQSYQDRTLKVEIVDGDVVVGEHAVSKDAWTKITGSFKATQNNLWKETVRLKFSTAGGTEDGSVFLDHIEIKGV